MAKRIPKKTDNPIVPKEEEKGKKPSPKKATVKNVAPKKATPPVAAAPKQDKTAPEKTEKESGATSKIPISDRVGPAKTKRLSEDKYERISEKADLEKFKEMRQKIQEGTRQWAYYAVDNEVGYHYYLVLKK